MSSPKKAKLGKKVPVREKAPKAVAKKPAKRVSVRTKKRVTRTVRKKARAVSSFLLPSFKFDVKSIRKKIHSLRNYWAFGMVGGSLAVAGGLIYVQKGVTPPAPLEAQVDLRVPSQTQIVHADAPTREPQREVAQAPAAAAPVVEDNGALASEFIQANSQSLENRIALWSDFLTHPGHREKLLSIKDAPVISDTAPLLPTKYDCTTYVETVIALARSQSVKDFYKNLISVRYRDGKTDYLNRNHFPEIDWIPNNTKAGILKDATWDIAENTGCAKRAEKKVIDRGNWIAQQVKKGKVSRALASVQDPASTGTAEAVVPYIALADVTQSERNIPDGAILNIVRKNKDGTPVLITHQGFVIHKDGKAWLRHASVGGNIKTQMLSDYLRELSKKASDKDWPVIGINLNQVL